MKSAKLFASTLIALVICSAYARADGPVTGKVLSIAITSTATDFEVGSSSFGPVTLCAGGSTPTKARFLPADGQSQAWLSTLLAASLAKKQVTVVTNTLAGGVCTVNKLVILN